MNDNELNEDRHDWRKGWRHDSPSSRIWTGLFLVIGGSLYLAYKMGADIPSWLFTWEMIPISIGLLAGLKSGFRNTTWIILVAVFGLILVENEVPDFRLHEYIWPSLVIMLGLVYILNPRRKKKRMHAWTERATQMKEMINQRMNIDKDSDDYIEYTAVFSGIEKSVVSKNFKGGSIVCVFGGAEIDMSMADIEEKAILDLTQIFGGVKLVIPPQWTVKNEVTGVFHGMVDKRMPVAGNGKLLVLTGTCIFGGVDIKSTKGI